MRRPHSEKSKSAAKGHLYSKTVAILYQDKKKVSCKLQFIGNIILILFSLFDPGHIYQILTTNLKFDSNSDSQAFQSTKNYNAESSTIKKQFKLKVLTSQTFSINR